MTMRAVYSYSNPDSTTDMNAHFRILFDKGVVSGGLISPVGGTYQVTVAPFAAVSADGMVIENDTTTTLTIPSANNILYHVVLIAQYNAPSAPTLQLQVVSATTYETTDTTNLVILGSVQIPGSGTVQSSHITYDSKHVTSKVGEMSFKGPLSSESAAPTTGSVGDLYMVLGNPPFFITFNANKKWVKFTDYSQLASDYESHITNGGGDADYTGTDKRTKGKHVTPAMLSALGGSLGSPGADNKYVTTADTARTLGAGERAGLTAALGGTLSADNPVISRNLAILEERVVSYTAAVGGQNNAAIATTINGTAVSIFVGTRGREAAVGVAEYGVSTARQFFRVEDGLGKGLVVNGKAIYVKDVTLNGIPFDTSGDQTDANGFWLGSGALNVVFNALIPASQTFFLRYNIKGDMTSLSPANRGVGGSGKYAIPPTGYQNRIESYIETYVLNAQAVLAESLEVTGTALFADGTEAAPSVSFASDPLTGMYYRGTTDEGDIANYSGLGFAVNGTTMLVLGRAAQNIDDTTYHILESDVDDNGHAYHKWAVTSTGSSERNVSFMFGTSNYLADFEPAFGIRTGTRAENFGLLYEPYFSIQRNVAVESFSNTKFKLSVMAGTDKSPSLVFDRSNSGFYYFDSVGDSKHTMYKGVGISIDGSPIAMFGNNSATTPDYTTNSVLMVERDSESSSGLRLGLWSGGNGPGALSIGYANYVTDWTEMLEISPGKGAITSSLDIDVAGRIDATGIIKGGSFETTGSALSAKYVASGNGTAAAPSFGFGGSFSNYGIYIETPAANADAVFGTLLSIGVKGNSHLSLGRDPWTIGSSAAMSSPLLINSFADGGAEFGYHISVPYLSGGSTPAWKNTLSFGSSYYNNDFRESLTFKSSSQGADAWYLYDYIHVSNQAGIFLHHSSDITDLATAVRLDTIASTHLGGASANFNSSVCAQGMVAIGTELPSEVSKLVFSAGSIGAATEFLESTGTVIKNWGAAQTVPADLSKAWNATTTADLAIALQKLIELLGYNASDNQNPLHSLFKYTHT